MIYKFELFLVIQKKMAHTYKIIQTLFSSYFIYRFRYMIMFFFVVFFNIGLLVYIKLTH